MLLLAAGVVSGAPWHASQLGQSVRSTWNTAQTTVYHDTASFRTAWSEMFPIPSARPALPAVDFSRYRVFVVALGTRPSGGYHVALDHARLVGDTAEITVAEYTPAPGCSYTQDLTNPAVAIAAPAAPVAYRVVTRVLPDTVRCN